MSLVIKPRSAWGAEPARARTPWTVSSLLGDTVHWTASPKSPADRAQVPLLIRAIQRFHMHGASSLSAREIGADPVARLMAEIDWTQHDLGVISDGVSLRAAAGEFNDIAYSFMVDLWGDAWECRGWDFQTGANGTSEANRTHLAICVLAGPGDAITPAAKDTVAAVIAEASRRGVGAHVVPHSHWTTTGCPGSELQSWVKSGAWKQKQEEGSDMDDWFWDWLEWERMGKAKPRPANVPKTIPQKAWDARTRFLALHRDLGPDPLYQGWRDMRLVKADPPENLPGKIPQPWWPAAERDHAFASRYATLNPAGDGKEAAELRGRITAGLSHLDAARSALQG